MTQSFFVPGPMPSLNEIISAAKVGGRGHAYAIMKRTWTNAVTIHAKAARIKPVSAACFHLLWHEKDRARNPDNVAASKKFILDGLVNARIIENDGWDQVVGFSDSWVVSAKAGVLVTIEGQ